MSKANFQRLTTKRIQAVAPDLKFLAFYHGSEERLNACMRDYASRSIVYILSSVHDGQEYYLYAGQSRNQYTRCLSHSKKYEFDHIYLFECGPEFLTSSEKAVIRELTPLFNRDDNPEAQRFADLLHIDYDAKQDAEMIQCLLHRYSNYHKQGLFGFELPVALFDALEREATYSGRTTSEMLQMILEQEFIQRGTIDLDHVERMDTNLTTTKGYGLQHQRSCEQVKQYLHQENRVPGAARVGRDWVIARDAKFPTDRRGERKVRSGEICTMNNC